MELVVRGLGGHLDFTRGLERVLTQGGSRRATHGVAAVGALPVGFRVILGLVRGKCLPAGLHAVESSYVSASFLRALRAAFVRSVVQRCPLPGNSQPVGWSGHA